ncbi:hypothetical protein DESUT3_24980 [Desulfuromonas versatilis]|uniref:Right handed beta helix domain-containing protein n=1 Tax=Desulfuromonas versatilis TaxID=2802975 RepID=A0ABM8HXW7_9BACT|nr:hypothetical protein DESUT3_24980 [Desulfuromonas versatilis]
MFLGGCLGGPVLVSGSLDGDVFWSGTIRIAGDVVLSEGSRLVIAPGTRVMFLPPRDGQDQWTDHPNFPGSELIIRGRVVAEGTAESPIEFRAGDPAAAPGSWGAINLEGSPEAVFRYCRFSQADSALHGRDSVVYVEHSLFEDNLVGIRFNNTQLLAEKNLLRRNGSAIRFHFGAPVICLNELADNQRAIFITSHPRDVRIEHNNILRSREYSVVFGEEVPEDVPLPHNYWGTMDPAVIEAGFFDGRREAHLGRVEYLPPAPGPVEGAGISWTP